MKKLNPAKFSPIISLQISAINPMMKKSTIIGLTILGLRAIELISIGTTTSSVEYRVGG